MKFILFVLLFSVITIVVISGDSDNDETEQQLDVKIRIKHNVETGLAKVILIRGKKKTTKNHHF